MLLSRTVLSELYQKNLVTEDEVKRMEGKSGYLLYQLVPFQWNKPLEVVTRTADIMNKFGYTERAMQLRGWCGSQTVKSV